MLRRSIDYQGLSRDFRTRFSKVDRKNPTARQACDRMCRKLTPWLVMDRDVSLEASIDRLEAKWRSDGLIGSEKERPPEIMDSWIGRRC